MAFILFYFNDLSPVPLKVIVGTWGVKAGGFRCFPRQDAQLPTAGSFLPCDMYGVGLQRRATHALQTFWPRPIGTGGWENGPWAGSCGL